jgi:transglutaminase-like putative cysteine protease
MICAIGFPLLCMFFLIISDTAADPHPVSHYTIPRQIQYSFTLQNTTNNVLKEVHLWAHAPVRETAVQRSTSLETSHPYELLTDDKGNQILHFTFHGLPPYASRIVIIRAALLISDSPAASASADAQNFLKAERFIESDHPDLRRIAKSLETSNRFYTVENIFQWVVNHMRYTGYVSDDRGALYAYTHGEGDCTEFMYLFVALCRAAGVPARCAGGYICKGNVILKPADYHNWAEFYEGGAWKIADPQNKVLIKNHSDYIVTRMMGPSVDRSFPSLDRFRYEGAGVNVVMN